MKFARRVGIFGLILAVVLTLAGGFYLLAGTSSSSGNASGTQKVSASFTYTSTNLSVTFDASASTAPDGIKNYTWSFGGGEQNAPRSTVQSAVTTHPYKKSGTYPVTLVVTGNDGQSAKTTQNVVVYGAQKSPSECAAGYNVVLNDNQHNRLVSRGVDVSHPHQTVDQVMKYAKHDPRILLVYWNASPLGKQSPLSDTSSLVENGCYSPHGRDVYQQTLAQYKMATVKKSTAPATGVNTGAYPGGQAFQEAPGPITGDRSAVQVTFPTGDVVYILHRCGNVVAPTPIPSVPKKPSPSPSPTKPTCHTGCVTTPPKTPCSVCVDKTQVQIPVQESGQPTKAAPGAPSNPPATLQPGPGGNQPPPSTSAPNGYNPSGGSAPGGGENNGGSTTVKPPNPNPTPSQGVPTSDPPASGDPGQPG